MDANMRQDVDPVVDPISAATRDSTLDRECSRSRAMTKATR
jgi:hypothetical protein